MAAGYLIVTTIVTNHLPELPPVFRERASQVVRKTAYDGQAIAQELVHFDTGALKGSITVRNTNGDPPQPGDLTLTWGTSLDYGVHQEYLPPERGGKAYLGPSAEAVRPGYHAAMKQIMDAAG